MANTKGRNNSIPSESRIDSVRLNSFIKHGIVFHVSRKVFANEPYIGCDTYDDGSIRWDGSNLDQFLRSRPKDAFDSLRKKIIERGFLSQFDRLNTEGLVERWTKLLIKFYCEVRTCNVEDFAREYIAYCDEIGYTPKAFENYGDVINKLRGYKNTNEKESKVDPNDTAKANNILHGSIEPLSSYESWLNPYNFVQIPFCGRKTELERLDRFILSEKHTSIWAIEGSSGSGKTRLVAHWIHHSDQLNNWNVQFLSNNDQMNPSSWATWDTEIPTLLILDHMYGFELVVREIIERLQKTTKAPVRFLVLDHSFHDELHKDPRWGYSNCGINLDFNKPLFFEDRPLLLANPIDQEDVIKSIISQVSKLDNDKEDEVKEALEMLRNIQGAYNPLFAALAGDAIRRGVKVKHLNRQELIRYYLSGERLTWNQKTLDSKWAAMFVVVATIQRGLHYNDLINHPYQEGSDIPDDFDSVIDICRKLVSNKSDKRLEPFEPDILGESFFLLFIEKIQRLPKLRPVFYEMLMVGSESDKNLHAIKFAAYIGRLAYNLIEESLDEKEENQHWGNLIFFLNPSHFPTNTPLRWATSISLVNIAYAIWDRDCQTSSKISLKCISRVDRDVFCNFNQGIFKQYSIEAIMKMSLLYALEGYENEISKKEFLSLFNQRKDWASLVHQAAFQGNSAFLVNWINAYSEHYLKTRSLFRILTFFWNIRNSISFVYAFQAKDRLGNTALHRACLKESLTTAKILIAYGARVNSVNNNGLTPLHLACQVNERNSVELVDFLISKKADAEKTDSEGNTALLLACTCGNTAISNRLIDLGADTNHCNEKGHAAIHIAVINSDIETIEKLLHAGTNIDMIAGDGFTPLMLSACAGQESVVKFLLEHGANPNIKGGSGLTAIILASCNGHYKVVEMITDLSADLIEAYKIAEHEGHTEISDFLFQKIQSKES